MLVSFYTNPIVVIQMANSALNTSSGVSIFHPPPPIVSSISHLNIQTLGALLSIKDLNENGFGIT